METSARSKRKEQVQGGTPSYRQTTTSSHLDGLSQLALSLEDLKVEPHLLVGV